MTSNLTRLLTVGGLAVALAGCGDALGVGNDNDADQRRLFATPADVESFIRSSYSQAFGPLLASDGINLQIAAASFENSPMAANFGMIERSAFPRAGIFNTIADQFSGDYAEVWNESYAAIRFASDGYAQFNDPDFTIGSSEADARAQAFANFVLGVAHASLALTYDQASIYDETVPAVEVVPFAPYDQVMMAALGYLDEAIALAESEPGMEFGSEWLGTELDAEQFVEIAHSLKARFRTQVARSPAERDAVDWAAVIADVDAGIQTDVTIEDDDNLWDFWMLDYMSFKGAWHQVNYMIGGMADTSGAYEAWMATPIGSRQPFLIQTPDLRFPQGNDRAAQTANQGLYMNVKGSGGGGGWVRAERGTWRWSEYVDNRFAAYYAQSNTGLPIPFIKKSEMDLIKAEALIQLDRADEALPLINATRVGNGGLPAATLAGAPGGNACVPQLPTGECGDLMETLKWEKRLENWMTVYGGWFFDSRGWGDLAENTYLHYPVPARELEVRGLPLYTFGGGGEGSAPVGTYGY